MRKIICKDPIPGSRRIVTKFLLWPRCFGRDWRWLEFANIVEEYRENILGLTEMGPSHIWNEVDFEDNRTQYIERLEEDMLEQND